MLFYVVNHCTIQLQYDCIMKKSHTPPTVIDRATPTTEGELASQRERFYIMINARVSVCHGRFSFPRPGLGTFRAIDGE